MKDWWCCGVKRDNLHTKRLKIQLWWDRHWSQNTFPTSGVLGPSVSLWPPSILCVPEWRLCDVVWWVEPQYTRELCLNCQSGAFWKVVRGRRGWTRPPKKQKRDLLLWWEHFCMTMIKHTSSSCGFSFRSLHLKVALVFAVNIGFGCWTSFLTAFVLNIHSLSFFFNSP